MGYACEQCVLFVCCLSTYIVGLMILIAFFHGADNPVDDDFPPLG